MQRSKRDRWKLLALIVLISTVAFCSAAYAQEQKEDWQTSVAEKKAEIEANQLERMDTDKDGSVSKEERKIYKQNRKEANRKIKEARKTRKKAMMDTDKDGSVSKEIRK
jgi:hypothetical protein